jgi:hypothetical protein
MPSGLEETDCLWSLPGVLVEWEREPVRTKVDGEEPPRGQLEVVDLFAYEGGNRGRTCARAHDESEGLGVAGEHDIVKVNFDVVVDETDRTHTEVRREVPLRSR